MRSPVSRRHRAHRGRRSAEGVGDRRADHRQWLDAEQTWHTEALTGALAVAFALQEVPLLSVHEMFGAGGQGDGAHRGSVDNFVAAGQRDYLPKWIKKKNWASPRARPPMCCRTNR